MKKYEITDIAHPDNPNLHRIRAVMDLTEDVLAGMLGGYVESYDNLDQEGRAWISADAIACENAVVCGDAVLTDHAVAKGCAYVGKNATVMGDFAIYTGAAVNDRCAQGLLILPNHGIPTGTAFFHNDPAADDGIILHSGISHYGGVLADIGAALCNGVICKDCIPADNCIFTGDGIR